MRLDRFDDRRDAAADPFHHATDHGFLLNRTSPRARPHTRPGARHRVAERAGRKIPTKAGGWRGDTAFPNSA